MQELKKIAHWISNQYASADKIVEIGVGNNTEVLKELGRKMSGCKLLATDIREKHVPENVDFFLDDVTDPNINIYRDSDLIYSIRAPSELYLHIRNLADKIGADILLKSASTEESPNWGKLVNYLGVAFYKKSNID